VYRYASQGVPGGGKKEKKGIIGDYKGIREKDGN